MPYIIPKNELPQTQYTPVKYKDEIAMLTIAPNGPIIMFPELDEIRFCSWEEIVAFAATAPIIKPEPAKESEKKVRNIQAPKQP